MPIELSPEQRRRAAEALSNYAERELELELGLLRSELLLDFFLSELAPGIYNQALRDAQDWLLAKLQELDANLEK